VPERHLLYDIEMAASLSVLQVLQGNYGLSNVKVSCLLRGHTLFVALADFKMKIQGDMLMLYLQRIFVFLLLHKNVPFDRIKYLFLNMLLKYFEH